jgi:N-methylhydantoinase B
MTATVDPITLEVIRSRMDEVVHNMEWLLFHSGYSPILRESYDGSACVLDADGRVVAAAGMPIHGYPYRYHAQAIIDKHGDRMRPGDSFLINDPYHGGAHHVPDVAAITPVFHDGRRIAFTASISHKPDVGGLAPGSSSAQSRELIHDGLLLTGVRGRTAEGMNLDVDAIMRANSRTPEELMGDVRAQIGCTLVGANRLLALADEYGLDVLLHSFGLLQDRAERLFRAELAELPDGEAEAEGFLDSDGADLETPVRFQVAVRKSGDRIEIDYTGCDPQARGPVNVRPQTAESAAVVALVGFLDPAIPVNEGIARAIDFVNPEGQVTHARHPAPVNNYFPTMQLMYGLIAKCLGELCPERALAPGGQGTGALTLGFPRARTGKSAVYYELMVSSLGGHPDGDGASLVLAFCHISTTQPIEIIETEYPVIVERFEPVPDSAGAGRHRGGAAFVREYRALTDFRLGLRSGGYKYGSWGVQGGLGPSRAGCTLNPGTENETSMPALFVREMQADDVVRVIFAGGGGLGDPRERDPELVLDDVRNGIYTEDFARETFGVVLGADQRTVDVEQTARLRTPQPAGDRG